MNYKQYLKEIMYLVQDDRKGILKLSMLFLFSAFLDLIGIGLIVPFITMLTSPEGVIFKEVSSIFIYFKIYVDNQEIIILSGLLLVFVFIIKALISILVYKVILSYCFNKGIYLRTHLMKSYQSLEYVDFIQKSSSEHIYKIHHAVELFYREILQPLLKSISDGMVVLFILAYLAWFDFKAFALLLGLLAVGVYLYESMFRNNLKFDGEIVITLATLCVIIISDCIL